MDIQREKALSAIPLMMLVILRERNGIPETKVDVNFQLINVIKNKTRLF